MKFIYSFFFISFVFITTGSTVVLSCFGSILNSNSSSYTADERYSNLSNQTEVEDKFSNTTSPAILSTDKDKDDGLLIVKVTIHNGKLGMNTSSDFIRSLA